MAQFETGFFLAPAACRCRAQTPAHDALTRARSREDFAGASNHAARDADVREMAHAPPRGAAVGCLQIPDIRKIRAPRMPNW